MSKNKWVRSISFNTQNEKDQARLKLIDKKSFSRFIKKLLDDEIQRQAETTNNTATPQQRERVIPQQPTILKYPQHPKKVKVNPMLKR